MFREWIEREWGAKVVTWAQPTDCGEVYEVLVEGELVCADSLVLLVGELAARKGEPRRALAA